MSRPSTHNTEATVAQEQNSQQPTNINSEKTPDADVLWVDWDGPNDPMNPKNWSYRKKWAATIVVSSFTFISPTSSSMVAPAAMQIADEFGITSNTIIAMIVSVFVLGYTVGPLPGTLDVDLPRLAFRFLAGIGGSAPLSIGGGVLGDIWRTEERGKAIAIYSLAPLLGPVLGPVCGGWVAERSTWRWVFWSTSIADVMVQISGVFFLQESFAPYLLEKKADKIKKTMDLENGPYKSIRTVFETTSDRSWKSIFGKGLTRPFQLFFYEPIIQLLGIYMAFVYGLFYVFLTSMPVIFAEIYHEGPGIAGLHYIALGISLLMGAQVNAQILDPIYIHFKNKNGGVGEPEFRLPTMVPGSIFLPIGLLIAGWSAQQHFHWIVTDIGIAFIGAALILVYQAMQTYIIDSFTLHAASALAATTCLMSLAGFGFPLFAPAMYEKLGYGKADTILACLAIVLGCPAPFLFWKYGRRIRMSSKHAHKPHQPQVGVEERSTVVTTEAKPC